jgi:hypothetical protein
MLVEISAYEPKFYQVIISAYELMFVWMTSTCFPHSYDKYFSVARAIVGVVIRSMVGSFAYEQKKRVGWQILQNP